MKKPAKSNRNIKKAGGRRYAALAILAVVVLAIGGYFLSPSSHVRSKRPEPPSPLSALKSPGSVAYKALSTPKEPPPKENVSRPTDVTPLPKDLLPNEKGYAKGYLAIIIDDMGSSVNEASLLADIGVPLTFSIIPGLRSYREVASFAAGKGIETMIHVPMQPKGWPQQRLEANGLLLSMDEGEVAERLKGFIRDIPAAVGVNNHMGSEFTEHEDMMRAALGTLKEKRMYFVDSVTSPKSVGQKIARELGVKSGKRHVFLDNEQNMEYIRGQLNQAVRLAKNNGGAIAICHPHPATISALAELLPGIQKQGITFVSASRLLR